MSQFRPHDCPARARWGLPDAAWPLVAVLLGGCLEPLPGPGQLEARRPPMPTAGARAPEAPRRTEAELRAAVVALVLTGDLAEAQKACDEAEEGQARQHLRVAAAQAAAAHDPRRAAEFSLRLGPGPTQTAALDAVVDAWWRRDPRAAEAWAVKLAPGPARDSAWRALAAIAVQDAPDVWLEAVWRWPRDDTRAVLLSLGVAAWTGMAPEKAITWMRSLAAGPERDRLRFTAAFAVAQRDPALARALVEELPEGRERGLVLHALAQTWVARDQAAALAWARGLPPGLDREAAWAGIDTGLGVPTSRTTAAGPVLPAAGSGGALVASRPDWPELASPEFARWLAAQAPGLSRDEAVLGYVRERMNGAGAEVGGWVVALPGGTTRDRALSLYLETLAPRAPAEAAAWLRGLPSSERSAVRIEQVGRAWLRVNPDAADAWLAENGIAPERREWLRFEAGR